METGKADLVVLSATQGEQDVVQRSVGRLSRAEFGGGRPAIRGQIGGRAVRIVVSGIGLVNTAQSLTAVVEESRPALVLQVGIGGAFPSTGLAVGDIAVATEEVLGEFGVLGEAGWSDGETIGIPLLDTDPPTYNRIPLDSPSTDLAKEVTAAVATAHGARTQAGPFLTVQNVTGTDDLASTLEQRFGVICENMEGAAAAQVCAIYGIPFVEIRGISNVVEKRDPSKWNIPLAAERAQEAALALIDRL